MKQQAHVSSVEHGGTQFVPFRTIVEQLGGTIRWDNQAKVATFTVRDVTGEIGANSKALTANGASHVLSAEPFVEDGVLYAPIDTLQGIGLTTG